MKQIFILGRNPTLSRAEVFSYFEARKINFEEVLFEGNFLILDIQKEINLNIQEFGGVLKIGKIDFVGQKKELLEFIEKNEIIPEDKFSFNVIGNYDIEQGLYKKFKSEKRKTQVRHGRGQIKVQGGDEFSIPNADFHIFCHKSNKIYLGLIEQDFSYEEIKNRDMHKPIRREALAISPRLAKILINLSQVKENQMVLDLFCGVGGVLQEALLKGINCIGIDKDKQAIMQANQNLEWLKKNYKINANYDLKNLDSRNLPGLQFDGVATEPSLGELTKRKLKISEAQSFIKKFENSIVSILQRLKEIKKPDAKIAITFPYVKKFSVNINRILKKTGLQAYNLKDIHFPIKEFREDQFISREIWVFI